MISIFYITQIPINKGLIKESITNNIILTFIHKIYNWLYMFIDI